MGCHPLMTVAGVLRVWISLEVERAVKEDHIPFWGVESVRGTVLLDRM